MRMAVLAPLLLFTTGAAFAGQQAHSAAPNTPAGKAENLMRTSTPNDLVRAVVQNELNAHDEGSYRYRDWRQTPDGSKTKEMVETRDGVVAKLIAINDHPLTPDQRKAEEDRLQNLLAHPELQQQKKKEQEQDADRVKKMFRELPNAFNYEYAGVEPGGTGELIHLKFKPNPNYNPPSRETAVFKAMAG